MNVFLLNILLAFAWAAVWGEITPSTLFVGFVLGFVALYVGRPLVGAGSYPLRVWRTGEFLVFYIHEVIVSNLRVAAQIVSPRLGMVPGIVAVPLDAETDTEITVLANLVSLTPGTLSMDVSEDRKTLYVHVMDLGEGGPETQRKDIKERLERRVLALLR